MILEHRARLIHILKDVYSDEALGPYLGFKGGTAAYLFYNLDRFSVDLDFDLLDETKKDSIFTKMQPLLAKHGTVKKALKKRYTLFYLLGYKNKASEAQNIKIEINLRQFGSQYEIKSYLGIPMKVMVQTDIAAHKLVAMYERMGKANRDIFDVQFFLKNHWPINKKIVEARTQIPFRSFLKKVIQALEKLGDQHILSGIGELLDKQQKLWAKKNLRRDTIFFLRLLMEEN